MFAILITEKGGAQRRLEIDKPEVTFGRVQGNDIILPKGNISKRHARLVLKNGRFNIVDLMSINGTYVNGQKITSPLVIKPGDTISMGDFIPGIDVLGQSGQLYPQPPPPQPYPYRQPTYDKRKEPGGLFAGGQRIPLLGVAIDVKAKGVVAAVSLAQRYRNQESVPLEAAYSLPTDRWPDAEHTGRERSGRGEAG